MNTDRKIKALSAHLGCNMDDIEPAEWETYGLDTFKADGGEFAVATDGEADAAVAEYIRESVWAFRPGFLASFTDLPEEIFTAMQDKCESSNDTILKLIERTDGGLDAFVEEAVSADGRGHFLSGYDGNENEEGEFFIYRTN